MGVPEAAGLETSWEDSANEIDKGAYGYFRGGDCCIWTGKVGGGVEV